MLTERWAIYRFASFEVEPRTGSLRRKGERVRIERLPMQILLALLEEPGKIVSREELRNRLWNDQFFAQADNNLQVAVAKLREALGEKASEPRFVRTVHRVGYQFICELLPAQEVPAGLSVPPPQQQQMTPQTSIAPGLPVPGQQPVTRTEASAHSGSPPVLLPALTSAVEGVSRPSIRRISRARFRQWLWIALAACAVVVTACALYQRSAHRPLAFEGETIALGDVINTTDDQGFDDVLSTAIRFKVQESPYINPIPEKAFLQATHRVDGSNTLGNRVAACRNLQVPLLLDGRLEQKQSVFGDGSAPPYQVTLQVWRCRDGRLLATETDRAASKVAVLPTLDHVVDLIRTRLGESNSSIQAYHAPLTEIDSSSLGALKAFTLAENDCNRGQQIASIPYFKLAILLDPQFALAYASLGVVYSNSHERELGQEYLRRAFDLRAHTSERGRLYIATHYYSVVTGQVRWAMQAYDLWRSIYPHDPVPAANLADEYLALGYPDKALGPARQAAKQNSVDGISHALYERALLETAQYSTLDPICRDQAHESSDTTLFHVNCLRLAVAQGDAPGLQRQLTWAHGNPEGIAVLEYAALAAFGQGQLVRGCSLFNEARSLARSNQLLDFAAELDLDEGGVEAAVDLPQDAHQLALNALRLAPGEPSTEAFAALVLARSGDDTRAQTEAVAAAASSPLDTILNGVVLPDTYAAIQMHRHKIQAALALMGKTRPLDGNSFMGLVPAYSRGVALLADKQFAPAEQAFQWVIDHRTLNPETIYVSLAMLQLGHTQQLRGDCNSATRTYQTVATAWRNADSSFAPLLQLKSLQQGCAAMRAAPSAQH